MRARPVTALLAALALGLAESPAGAADATGSLDAATPAVVGGWARDPDFAGPIPVHVYIDGHIAHAMLADAVRPDLPFADKAHGFSWTPPPLGPGQHQVVVYAIGVDAQGVPVGVNPPLPGSPKTISDGCGGLAINTLVWCQGVPNYYVKRAKDTAYLFSDALRVGVNGSYGGTIFELYGPDHSRNRLVEHGGGAVQLSVWGYEPKGPDAVFSTDTCDPTPYPSDAACKAGGHGACRLWCCSEGAHVADCNGVTSCAWGAGSPWNPIMAQAENCGWDSPANDVDVLTKGASSVSIKKTAPYHFTKSNSMPGMVFEETATLEPAGVRLDYRVAYSGKYVLGPHPQEIPAVFPGAGMNRTYFFYAGGAPYQDAGSAVTKVDATDQGLMLRLANRAPYPHANVDATITEDWVSACDAAGTTCLTLAVFSKQYKEINAAGWPGNGEGYLTPLGGFAIVPGLDESFTARLYPYRYDEVVGGKSIRQWIYDVAATQGCLALGGACDDGDPCTAGDACRGDGTCAGTPIPACGAGGAGGATTTTTTTSTSSTGSGGAATTTSAGGAGGATTTSTGAGGAGGATTTSAGAGGATTTSSGAGGATTTSTGAGAGGATSTGTSTGVGGATGAGGGAGGAGGAKTTGAGGTGTGHGGAGRGGSSGIGAGAAASALGDGAAGDAAGGCGCRVARSSGETGAYVAAITLLALARRRRARDASRRG
jgi:hypothetical protein